MVIMLGVMVVQCIFILIISYVTAKENSAVTFHYNRVEHNGGVMYVTDSTILFKGNSIAIFDQNSATTDGAAMYFFTHS